MYKDEDGLERVVLTPNAIEFERICEQFSYP